jgi:predicted nucleic acid-binding protein
VLDRVVATREPLLAPILLQIEVVSGLRRLERLGSLRDGELGTIMAVVQNLSIEYHWDDAWLARALEVARATGASRIYDSLYFACAESIGATLYTCDAAFVRGFRDPPSNIVLVEG